jgi:AcrR family transcriptional regulator
MVRANTRRRTYRQIARAQTTLEGEARVLEAASKLFAERYYDEVTLADVAALAGVSTKTVSRRFGTKEALAARFIEAAGQQNGAVRDAVPVGDVAAATSMISEVYELFGDSVMRTLSLDGRISVVTAMAAKGRELHWAWLERVFGPLVKSHGAQREVDLALLLVATDVFTWKLLRRDRGFSREETARAMRQMVDQVLFTNPEQRALARKG